MAARAGAACFSIARVWGGRLGACPLSARTGRAFGRELSQVVEKSASRAKFRMTPHSFVNPVNKPDEFEARALDPVSKAGPKAYDEVLPGSLWYARTPHHKVSGSRCHGDPERAPNDVKVRYGTEPGFNVKEGDGAGIPSVRVPPRPFMDVGRSVIAPWQIARVVPAFRVSCFFLRVGVVEPIRRIPAATAQIPVGQEADLGGAGLNGLRQRALATECLRTRFERAAKRVGCA